MCSCFSPCCMFLRILTLYCFVIYTPALCNDSKNKNDLPGPAALDSSLDQRWLKMSNPRGEVLPVKLILQAACLMLNAHVVAATGPMGYLLDISVFTTRDIRHDSLRTEFLTLKDEAMLWRPKSHRNQIWTLCLVQFESYSPPSNAKHYCRPLICMSMHIYCPLRIPHRRTLRACRPHPLIVRVTGVKVIRRSGWFVDRRRLRHTRMGEQVICFNSNSN